MTTLETRIARAREVGAKAVAVEIDVLAAKDAEIARLIAERDKARAQRDAAKHKMLADLPEHAKVRAERNEAQAEVARLKGLLREARHFLWDVPGITVCARIDAALATEDTP